MYSEKNSPSRQAAETPIFFLQFCFTSSFPIDFIVYVSTVTTTYYYLYLVSRDILQTMLLYIYIYFWQSSSLKGQ